MMYFTKIASATGQKWKGLFQARAKKLAAGPSRREDEQEEGSEDSGRVDAMTTIHDGYVGRSTRRRDTITTQVIDPGGVYMGAQNDPAEGSLLGGAATVDLIYDALPRDAYNPLLELQQPDPVPMPQRFRRSTYYAYRLGNYFPEFPWGGPGEFRYGYSVLGWSPGESLGVSTAGVACNIDKPSEEASYNTIKKEAKFASACTYALGSPLGYGVTAISKRTWFWFIHEDEIARVRQDYYLCTRYSKFAYTCRQLPYAASVRHGSRMAAVGTIVTNPVQIDDANVEQEFPHRGGKSGLFIHVSRTTTNPSGQAENLLRTIRLEDMNLGGVEPEDWDPGLPWVQFYPDYSTDPPNDIPVGYPPLGEVLYEDNPPEISGAMSNAFGCPTACAKENSMEFLVDFRIARTWVDTRSIDRYPELQPITIQCQTGVILVKISGFSEESFGSISTELVVQDVSGSKENGSYAAYGGSDEDVHRLWRTQWSGNAGGRHVALLSVVRHERFEESNPGVEWLKTAQSSFASLGTDPPRLAEDPVAIQLYVDGVFTERLSTDIGYSFLDNVSEDELMIDDCTWVVTAHKWATVVADGIVFFTAYSYPDPTEIVVVRWDVGSGGLSVVRRIPKIMSGHVVRPAITCYHQQVMKDGKEVSTACILLRVGNQAGPGWVELTKDYGVTWVRVMGDEAGNTKTPGLGAFYFGSELVGVDYGQVFKE